MEYDEYEGKSKGITAFGYYKQDGKFVVLKGSFAVGDSQLKKSFFNDPIYRGYPEKRQEFIDTKKLEEKAYSYQFTEDVEFDDVSPAASIIWGSNRNGKRDFKPNGKKVRVEENIRSVNKTPVLKPDSIKTVETPVLAEQPFFKEEDDELAFPEGKEFYRLHKSKERNKAVIDLAKKKAKDRDPLLCCSVCDFSFLKKYGVIGEDFIEAHHTKPLSETTEEVETKVEDLALVCSNCHRMLHRKRPWLSISNLKSILNDE
jgi:hypothetical protein